MKFSCSVVALVALAQSVVAAHDKSTFSLLRFTSSQLTKGRMDPIVSPGKPSQHVHGVLGGSAFSMKATGSDMLSSQCTNAQVKADKSAYWFPSLYFKDPKTGVLESVDMYYAQAYYYFDQTHDDIKAFPVGLKIVTGDQSTRTPPKAGAVVRIVSNSPQGPVQPISWTCPRQGNTNSPPTYPVGSNGSKAGMAISTSTSEGVGFPDAKCDGFASPLRANLHYPSCYNPSAGLNDVSKNMQFPIDAGNGYTDCPQGYIHVPRILLQVYWNTAKFNDRWTHGTGAQPFVLANGDVTGFSSHADFLAGWDVATLQNIIDNCDSGTSGMNTCPGVVANSDKCTIPSEVNEQVDGSMSALPGTNPLTGWSYSRRSQTFRA